MANKHRRGASVYLWALGAAALVCLVISVWFLWRGSARRAEPLYLLKDNAGHLALYTGDGTGPLAQYDEIYTRLLPEADVLALQQGVPVYSETELEKRLEDYGF